MRTDAELAARIRAAVEDLNDAVDAAYDRGISVRFVSSSLRSNVHKTHVSNVRIERSRNWLAGFEGETL